MQKQTLGGHGQLVPHDLMVSITYLTLVALAAQLVRRTCRRSCRTRFQRVIVKDFVSAIEMTMSCFEFGTVIRYHGMGTFSAILFFLILWRKYSWQYVEEDSVSYCPCNDLTQFWKGKMSFALVIAKEFADVLATPLAYRLTNIYWSLGLRPEHAAVMKSNLPENCVSEIAVSLGPAMLTEALGTIFLCLIWAKARASECQTMGMILGALVTLGIVNLTMPFTGAYFSPALASAKMWNCKGSTVPEHIMTYWIAPIAAEIAFEAVSVRLVPPEHPKED